MIETILIKDKLNNTKSALIARFGYGTVHMDMYSNVEGTIGDIIFATGEKRDIGEKWLSKGDKLIPELIFRFNNFESIDAVIDELNELKNLMNKQKEKSHEKKES
jgi:hypothetical protein